MGNEVVCVVCGQPAERVIAGADYCDRHRDGDRTAAVPIVACDICGEPAIGNKGSRPLCGYHLPRLAA